MNIPKNRLNEKRVMVSFSNHEYFINYLSFDKLRITTIKSSVLLIQSLLFISFLFSSCGNKDTGYVNGMKLPNIEVPSVEAEKKITIDALKGNIVLVDFWASWCAPCRKTHPKLLEVAKKYEYAQFKNAQRFLVLSISLDNDSTAWRDAITKDKIESFMHASELIGWKSECVSTYKINAIPASFLIDENGTIVGKNIGWRDLDLILSKRVF